MLFPTFLTLLLPTLSLSQSATANHESEVLVIPEGTGPYSTSYSEHELIDDSRLDPFNSSHVRRIMVTRFDPVPKEKCKRTLIPYCSRVVCATEGQILEPYDWPADLWSKFRLQVCEDKKKTGKRNGYRGGNKGLGSRGKFPIALYSAGLNTTRQFSNSLVQEIASHGFTVVSVDHPYDTDVVDFPNGDVIYGNRVIKPVNANGSTASVEHALEVRAQDASFVLDVLGFTKHDHDALFFGHSMGGAAAGTALLNDLRFRAGVNFDGMMFGRVLSTPFGTPSLPQAFLFFGMEGHNSSSDPSWGELWDTLEENPNADYYKMFNLINGTHGSWWDLNILVDVAGLRDELTETAQLLISPLLDGAYVWKVMGRYVPSFFWYVLGMKPEDEVLKGPSEEFPGVVLVE